MDNLNSHLCVKDIAQKTGFDTKYLPKNATSEL